MLSMRTVALAVSSLVVASAALASRSGLNNVPNADTSAPRTGVVQLYSAFGEDRQTSFLTGVRSGLKLGEQKFEAGLDSRWAPGADVVAFLNAKYAFPRRVGGPAFALGIAGLAPESRDRARLGEPQSYAVATLPFDGARLHAGYAVQRRNNAAFVGFDRAWQVAARPLTLRADAIQIQDRAQWLASIGFTYRASKLVGLELWRSFPTERGRSYTTAKLGLNFAY